MMKRVLCLSVMLGTVMCLRAAVYPPEWNGYATDRYICDIQSDCNDRGMSETAFKENLLNIARSNLAKQIKIRVQDHAELIKHSSGSEASVIYHAETRFSTDIDLRLVETETSYDRSSKEGSAIAYIDKVVARSYYKNELTLAYNKISNSLAVADNYVATGFKSKAQAELELSLHLFEQVDEPLFWLNIFGASQSELSEWQMRFNECEQNIKQKLADLKHGTVIYLSCTADIFGTPYPTLQNELKGILAADGCSFTDNADTADWAITVICTSREYSNVHAGNSSSYFSYVDARIVIDKVITSQRIYEDEVSAKGGHILGYKEAARAGYKDIKQKIGKIIKENIIQ